MNQDEKFNIIIRCNTSSSCCTKNSLFICYEMKV